MIRSITVAAPATAFGRRIAVSIEIADAGGAIRFHASDALRVPHIASFISIWLRPKGTEHTRASPPLLLITVLAGVAQDL